jgi:sugar phosphate isomerase/epimerase
MKLGISTHLFGLWPLDQNMLRLTREAGFSGVELWAMAPHLDIEQPGAVAHAVELVRGVGLQVYSVHLPFYRKFGSPDFRFLGLGDHDRTDVATAVRLITNVLNEMGDAGVGLGVLHAAGATEEPLEQALQRFEQDLEVVLKVADDKGVTLALENIITPLSSVERIVSLIERRKHPRVKACLDVGHAAIAEDPVAAIRMLGDHLVTTHLHDNHGEEDDHLSLGDGILNWDMIAQALANASTPNLILEISFKEIKDISDQAAVLGVLQKCFSQAKHVFNSWNLA